MLRLLMFFVVGLFGIEIAAAHPSHNQITEIEWNGSSGRFEIAMRLNAAAFEDALSVRAGHKVRLNSIESADKLVVGYLTEAFEIDCQGSERPGSVTWHGLELELHSVWLYFEYTPQLAGRKQLVHDGANQQEMSFSENEDLATPKQVRIRIQCVTDVRPQFSHFVSLCCGDLNLQGHCDRSNPWALLQSRGPVLRPMQQLVD